MDRMDDVLSRLAEMPPPAFAADLDMRVMAGLQSRRAARMQRRMLGIVALAALSAGGVSAWTPARDGGAMAVAPPMDLAPSTLLAPVA